MGGIIQPPHLAARTGRDTRTLQIRIRPTRLPWTSLNRLTANLLCQAQIDTLLHLIIVPQPLTQLLPWLPPHILGRCGCSIATRCRFLERLARGPPEISPPQTMTAQMTVWSTAAASLPPMLGEEEDPSAWHGERHGLYIQTCIWTISQRMVMRQGGRRRYVRSELVGGKGKRRRMMTGLWWAPRSTCTT